MKKLLFLILLFLCIGILLKFGVVVGGFIILISGFVAKAVFDKIDYSRTIDEYKTKYEDIFVISRHPDTDNEFKLPTGFDQFVVWADFEDVMEEVKDQKEWLREAGNMFFVDPGLKEHEKIQVHAIIFQDGEFVNEDWSEEFPERAIIEIKNKRVIRHGLLREANLDWYNKHSNRQRGVAWQPQKS